MTSKADLRQQLKGQLLPPIAWDGAKMVSWLKGQTGVWGAYQPLKGELDPQAVIRSSSHIKWVYPRISQEGMSFHELDGRPVVKGSLAWEPPADAPMIDIRQISGFLIPGLAFDLKGFRLGRGKGYYDQYLTSFVGIKVGVVPQARLFPELPLGRKGVHSVNEHYMDPWDVRMNYLATEDQFVVCQV